jgi:hypothetical protein
VTEELTAEERALVFSAAGELKQQERATKQVSDALLDQRGQDIKEYKDRLFAAESRLAEATALLKLAADWFDSPQHVVAWGAHLTCKKIRDFLSASPAPAAEPSTLDGMLAQRWEQAAESADEQLDAAHERIGTLLVLLGRIVKYAREDRATTPGYTRLARALAEAEKLLSASPAQAPMCRVDVGGGPCGDQEPCALHPAQAAEQERGARFSARVSSVEEEYAGKEFPSVLAGAATVTPEQIRHALAVGMHEARLISGDPSEHPDTIALRNLGADYATLLAESNAHEIALGECQKDRDGWKRAAESQNRQWSAKCEELTECRAELEATTHNYDDLLQQRNRLENEADAARAERDTLKTQLAREQPFVASLVAERDTALGQAEASSSLATLNFKAYETALARIAELETAREQHGDAVTEAAGLRTRIVRAVAELERMAPGDPGRDRALEALR